MTTAAHTLCLDNAQTFTFQPRPAFNDVVLIRKAANPSGRGLTLTGVFPMTIEEARQLWRSLLKDGAFRA